MYNIFSDFIKNKARISVIQAENPDGDSLGSALALESILDDREISLYCPVDLPKYLRYFDGWSRVTSDFDFNADGYIIVDTAAEILLSKLLEDPAIKDSLEKKPVFVLDHHETEDDLTFPHEKIIEVLPSCCSLIFKIAKDQKLEINKIAADMIFNGLLSDTLGLTTASVQAEDFETAAELTRLGSNVSELEEHRKEFMKKSQRILDYKADLIKRIEYSLDGKLATVHIPWDDIQEYSDEYNPNVLILEEMRMVEGVEVAVAIKTYPDGKLTGKVRTSIPVADKVAGYFGGGGHPYAAGFRTYDLNYEDCVRDLVSCCNSLIENDVEEEETVSFGSF
ncbi:DHH family phosphoesterase [Candidatus Saccharibacteria bacterium]|nr:DHH family phosphoesterase [Candidatus Saccharibacteria bacterium]